MYVYINSRRIRVNDTDSIGKGGEADIFRLDEKTALKIFKSPNHPDFQGLPGEQRAAELRIQQHQTKLRAFPKNLPVHIVKPIDFATDQSGAKIIGYTMPFIKDAEVLMRYSDRNFREQGIDNETVMKIFRNLHATLGQTHGAGAVIGDFNDLNIMVLGTNAFIIDVDSMQFGKFFCSVFTEKFVDPLLCNPRETSLMLAKPHNANSDWYAYAIMLMQSILYVGPYGGIYLPKNPAKKIVPGSRPLHRITVFNPEVRYPKPAIHYKVLPDEMLQYFHLVFEKDKRGEFPQAILNLMRWTKCAACGIEHARSICPECALETPAAVKEVTHVRGKVVSTRFFKTSGKILFATAQGNELSWIFHENGEYKREDGSSITRGELDPHIRFRIQGKQTLLGKDGLVITFAPGKTPEKLTVESFGNLPIFDANEHSRYWALSGKLMRDGALGPEYIGDILARQTLFWVGPKFGFGFYRAGNLNVSFVFDATSRGMNDNVKLPPIQGQLIDSTCVFTNDRCWFFTSTQIAGKTIHRCAVILKDGAIEAIIEGEHRDLDWIGNLRGKFAAGTFLLSATDDGIVRVEANSGKIIKTKEFPDTEPFVNANSNLFAGKSGLYVVDRQEIKILKIA